MGADAAGALIRAAAADCIQIRRLHGDLHIRAQAIRRVKQRVQIRRRIFQSHKHIHQNRLMPFAAQRLAHAGAGYQRNRSLRGDATGKTTIFMWKIRTFLFYSDCDEHIDTIIIYCNYSSLAQTAAEYNMNF